MGGKCVFSGLKLIPIFLALGFLTGINGFAQQTIGSPTISQVPVCAGTEIQINFTVTNGKGKPNHFTTSTNYNIYFGYLNATQDTLYLAANPVTTNSSTAPLSNNGATETIQFSFNIPRTTLSRNDFRIGLSSTDPEVALSLTTLSEPFTVHKDNYWSGAIDTDWNKGGNWSCNYVPDAENDVFIPAGLSNYPLLNIGNRGLCRDISIDENASLIIDGNWLEITGDITNSGNLDVLGGSILFKGTTAQTLPSETFLNNRIKDIALDNPAGLILNGPVEITGTLLAETGNLTSNGNLLLISNASQTAFIDGSGGGKVIGTVKMQRYLSNGFGYKYFSSPFSNSTVGDFSGFMELTDGTSGFPHFYEYQEDRKDSENNDLTGWQAYTETGNILNVAEGYALNLSDQNIPVNIEISGEVNNGPVNISLENSNGLYTKGFNLVGNPYPSAINWDVMAPSLSGVDNAIYFFTAGTQDRYTGTYTSYVNGVSTDDRSSNIIPSMQGFFVRVSNPGTMTLNFTNAARTGNQVTQSFYKAKDPRVIPQLKLIAGFSGENSSDAAVIYFNTGGTIEFEKDLDAFKLLNTAIEIPSLYSLTTKQEKLSINAISSTETQEIPLGIKTERSGKMFIELVNVENIFPSVYIYLKDLKNKLVHDFTEESLYSFTSQKGEINDQFSLILSSEKLSENELKSNLDYFSVHSAEGEILVKLNLSQKTSGNVILSNISGQVLQHKSGKEKEEIIFGGMTAPGVYLISLELDNERFTKKILIKK